MALGCKCGSNSELLSWWWLLVSSELDEWSQLWKGIRLTDDPLPQNVGVDVEGYERGHRVEFNPQRCFQFWREFERRPRHLAAHLEGAKLHAGRVFWSDAGMLMRTTSTTSSSTSGVFSSNLNATPCQNVKRFWDLHRGLIEYRSGPLWRPK